MTDYNLFDIDMDRLDKEWENLPRIYHDRAVKLADARADLERTKAKRDVIDAELDKDIRGFPDTYGLTKITEPAVEKAITLQGEHQAANEAVIQAKHRVDVLTAVVDALDCKKKALEASTQLAIRDYNAGRYVPNVVNKEQRDKQLAKSLGPRRSLPNDT